MPVRIDQARVQGVAQLARELSDPVRVAVLGLLADEAWTASQLADELGIAAPRLANHLTRLRDAGIVTVTRPGRHAIYRLADPAIALALSALQALIPLDGPPMTPSGSQATGRARRPDTAMAEARTCYDHLAGRLGVAVFDCLVAADALLPPPGTEESGVALGPGAAAGFAALGVDVSAPLPPRRKPAVICLDWTERRPHLGGALGAAILDRALSEGWVTRTGRRTLRVMPAGRQHLPAPAGGTAG